MNPAENDLRFVVEFPGECCAEVSRRGEAQPCDKTAVAVAAGGEDERWWPVCAYHARGRRMVPLSELVTALLVARDGLLEAVDDAIDGALGAHWGDESVCSCGARNNMDGDVLHAHRVGVVSDAVRGALERGPA